MVNICIGARMNRQGINNSGKVANKQIFLEQMLGEK